MSMPSEPSVRIRQRGIFPGFQNRQDFCSIPTFRDHACSQNVVINVKKTKFFVWRQCLQEEKSQSIQTRTRVFAQVECSLQFNQESLSEPISGRSNPGGTSLVQFLKQTLAARSRDPDPWRGLYQDFGTSSPLSKC
jgi:hypothetical protein